MTPTETKLHTIKVQLDAARAKRDRAQGELDSIKRQLKKEFGVSTLKEARALLNKMQRDCDAADAQLKKDVASLEQKYDWGGMDATPNPTT